MNPRISIISVNYNGFALTCAMIDSLRRHVTTPIQIVVVDNGSECNQAAMLSERYPDIVAIRSDENLGFAGGNNLGIAQATGDYLLLLNNDTEVEDDSLHDLCQVLDSDATIGVVCPKIRFFTPPRNIQFAGYTPLTGITLRNSLIGFGEADSPAFDTPHDTPYAHGAAMMIRREALAEAGPMPERYFLYYEELDWSLRITEKGWRIAYAPRAVVFHKESATTGQSSPLRTYYLTRNRLLFAHRNGQGTQGLLSKLYLLGVALPKSVITSLLQRRSDLARAALSGAADFIAHKTGKK